jgi:metallophosphoesterase (TIGR00282 family)
MGRAGRRAVIALLPGLRERYLADFVIANAENAAGGIGITEETTSELLELGIDVLTTGNHVWDKKGAGALLDRSQRILRPANYPPGAPGRGAGVFAVQGGRRVAVANLQGRVFMRPIDCPFRAGAELAGSLRKDTPIVIFDVHAEATSEKMALAWHLAGRATAVVGTHTHVPTADETILAGHTAYITDVGMTGPSDSVIGIRKELSIARFLTQLPERFEVAGGRTILSAVLIEAAEDTGAARSIERVAAFFDPES